MFEKSTFNCDIASYANAAFSDFFSKGETNIMQTS